MQEYIKKSKQWKVAWLVVWAIMYLLVILAYHAKPSVLSGWMPSSVMITFGLMVATLILGYVFCKQRFKI